MIAAVATPAHTCRHSRASDSPAMAFVRHQWREGLGNDVRTRPTMETESGVWTSRESREKGENSRGRE